MLGLKRELSGHVAIVTGGSQGIGLGIADSLYAKGATVVLADVNPPGKKVKYNFVECDVSQPVDVANLIEQVLKRFKHIDILVNNAGLYPSVLLKDMTEEQWDRVISVNLKGVFLCTKAVLPTMMKQNYGRIINISSIAGSTVGFQGLSHYCATKAGMVGFTKAVALELAQSKITVNAVSPGAILTPGVQDLMSEDALANFAQNVPAKRIGSPKDIGEVVAFLSLPESSYITGQNIVVDGGFSVQ